MKRTSMFYWLYMASLAVLLFTLKLQEFKPPEAKPPVTQPYKHDALAQYISSKWSLDYDKARNIIQVSEAYGRYDFPNMYDILAIIAIESGFDDQAVSSSNAKGLMQVLYKPTSFDIYGNILDGVLLLRENYTVSGSIKVAVQAYNVGLTAYKNGSRNNTYLKKFLTEKERLQNEDLFRRT